MAMDQVGARLRALRSARGLSLAQLSEATGIAVSSQARVESGARKPSLEQLVELADAFDTSIDEMLGRRVQSDPRVKSRAIEVRGRTMIPLTRQPGGMQAWKMIIPPEAACDDFATHEGYEWLYVLSGRLRLRLGDLDLTLRSGEAAEFDTHTPHQMSAAGNRPCEALVLFGPQGERMHVRARPRAARSSSS